MLDNDHFDNDCDMLFDEELDNNIDDDGDGLIDEDIGNNDTIWKYPGSTLSPDISTSYKPGPINRPSTVPTTISEAQETTTRGATTQDPLFGFLDLLKNLTGEGTSNNGTDGIVILPNGVILYPNGTIIVPDSGVLFPNGTIMYNNGNTCNN